jgi:DNA polymerase (family 10)
MAIDAGVNLAINTDAHSASELEFMPYGVNQAWRAWVQQNDVLNALPLSKLRTRLKR